MYGDVHIVAIIFSFLGAYPLFMGNYPMGLLLFMYVYTFCSALLFVDIQPERVMAAAILFCYSGGKNNLLNTSEWCHSRVYDIHQSFFYIPLSIFTAMPTFILTLNEMRQCTLKSW